MKPLTALWTRVSHLTTSTSKLYLYIGAWIFPATQAFIVVIVLCCHWWIDTPFKVGITLKFEVTDMAQCCWHPIGACDSTWSCREQCSGPWVRIYIIHILYTPALWYIYYMHILDYTSLVFDRWQLLLDWLDWMFWPMLRSLTLTTGYKTYMFMYNWIRRVKG